MPKITWGTVFIFYLLIATGTVNVNGLTRFFGLIVSNGFEAVSEVITEAKQINEEEGG